MQQLTLIPRVSSTVRWSDGRLTIRIEQALCLVSLSGVVLFRFALCDVVALRYAAVTLIDDGYLQLQDLPLAFGYNVRSYYRWKQQLEEEGLSGLRDHLRRNYPWKMRALEETVRALFEQGESKLSIASRLGVSEHAVRYTTRRLGLKRQESEQLEWEAGAGRAESDGPTGEGSEDRTELWEEEASPASSVEAAADSALEPATVPGEASREPEAPPPVATLDIDPLNRVRDRMLASQGLLTDAAPWFTSGVSVPCGGVLLAVPLLVRSGILATFSAHYPDVLKKAAFYGLRTTVMTLLFMALLRVKRPENLKENDPVPLGRVLGLDRCPEVKTLRRKLSVLAAFERGAVVMRAMAKQELRAREELAGFLYIDGHVREYHGKGSLSQGYSTRRRLGVKSATDTYINDAQGEPLFLVTSELNEGLTQVLWDIAQEVKALLGEGQRFTMVFDRGGWSPELFARLFELGVDVLTYRKGKVKEATEAPKEPATKRKGRSSKKIEIPWRPLYAHDSFQTQQQVLAGVTYQYTLLERSVRMGKLKVRVEKQERPFWMREVTRLCEDNEHLTQVMTTRQDLSSVEVLYRMFNRWRQENFFKYMRQEYAIDALVEYATEAVSGESTRPNPERRKLQRELARLQAEFKRRTAEYGELLMDNPTRKQPTVADFKLANEGLGQELEALRSRLGTLKEELAALPERVSAIGLERLATERKLVTDTLKMCAYRLETGLVRLLGQAYARTEDEGRKLIVAALRAPADLQPLGDELRVTLGRQSSPHRDRALSVLCTRLNELNTLFPGSRLRLSFAATTDPD